MGELYILSGDDDFERKRRSKSLVLKLSGLPPDAEVEENDALEIVSGDADDVKPPQIAGRFLDALRTPPFLCDHKLLWLRHFPDFELFNDDAEPFKTLVRELSEPLPDEVTVVIDAPGFDQRKQFARKLKTAGAKIDVCGSSGRASDKNWAESRRALIDAFARREGRRIDFDAMQFLCEAIGGDTGTLTNELEKVVCYAGNAPVITLDMCRNVVSRTAETLGWEFTASVIDGNAARALTLLHQLIGKSGDELRILYMLSKEFKQMVQTHLAMRQLHLTRVNARTFDAIPDEVRSASPDNVLLKMHPYRAFKVCEAAMRQSPEELAEKLTLLRDAARQLVSGGNPTFVMEQLTLQLSSRRKLI